MPFAPRKSYVQTNSITNKLKGICREYPSGGAVIREIIQNADDAGATEVRFILDPKTYNTNCLTHEGQVQYQGPALLCWNNSTFKDADFQSLSDIENSGKLEDETKTGKFGKGFNSVYHWTDSPSVLSRSTLYIQDPQMTASHTGGDTYDFIEQSQKEEVQNHMPAFSRLIERFDRPADFSIIRIPLRTKAQASKSKISEKEVTVMEIADVLEKFAEGFSVEGLLFMRNLEKITIEAPTFEKIEIAFVDREHIRKHRVHINRAIKNALHDGEFDFNLSFEAAVRYSSGDKSTEAGFIMNHTVQSRSMSDELQAFSRQEKFTPWVAVAVNLSEEHAKPHTGALYTVLPLQIRINQPALIHGIFSLSPDRASLHHLRDNSTRYKNPAEWNKWLFETLIPIAWTNLLLHKAQLHPDRSGFPHWPRDVQDPNDFFARTLHNVVAIIENMSYPLWYTSVGYVKACDGLLAKGEESEELKSALVEAKAPVIYVPVQFRPAVASYFDDCMLSPQSLCKFLHAKNERIRKWTPETKNVILEYLLFDLGASGGTKLELFPCEDGCYRALHDNALFFHRDQLEAKLFSAAKQSNLDLNRLSPQIKASLKVGFMNSTVHSSLRHRCVADMKNYALAWIFKGQDSNQDVVRLNEKAAHFVSDCWTWMEQNDWKISNGNLSGLWLLPLSNGQYRKLRPRCYWTICPPDGKIGDLLLSFARRQINRNQPLMVTGPKGVNPQILALRKAEDRSQLKVRDGNNLVDLVEWLSRIPEAVAAAAAEDKEAILQHISQLFPLCNERDRRSISNSIQVLQLFPKFIPNRLKPQLVWACINDRKQSVALADAVSPIPDFADVQFLDAREDFVRDALKNLWGMKTLSTKDAVGTYIIPAWQGKAFTGTSSCKQESAYLLLQHYSSLSPQLQKDTAQLPIFPSRRMNGEETSNFAVASALVDPSSKKLGDLFFEDEEVLPSTRAFEQHKIVLKECGLKSVATEALLYDRILVYGGEARPLGQVRDRARKLLAFEWPTTKSRLSIPRALKWLPVTNPDGSLALAAASDCRPFADRLLVGFELPTLDFHVSTTWADRLGWDEPIPTSILLSQLAKGIDKKEKDVVEAVLKYFIKHSRTEAVLDDLKQLSCVFVCGQKWVTPSEAFFEGCSQLAPYLEDVDLIFARDFRELLSSIGVRQRPGANDLLWVQSKIDSETLLSEADALVAIKTIELASRDSRLSLKNLKILDKDGRLRPIGDVNFNDDASLSVVDEVFYTDPRISRDLADKLGIEPLSERVRKGHLQIADIDDEDEFIQEEKAATNISDDLERYTVSATFREYLANADDAGATEIHWLLEKGSYPIGNLLTEELRDLQGSALIVHNNGVFSDNDFKGLKQLGVGSKRNNEDVIGQFGRGSKTMFHFSDAPMILSGGFLLILEQVLFPLFILCPLQKYLNWNYKTHQRKRGVKIPLSKLREAHPDQLAPFHGLWGYTQDLDYYDGTIFRLGLRNAKSPLREHKEPLSVHDVEKLLTEYFHEARSSLLFLKRIKVIDFRIRGQDDSQWFIEKQPKSVREEDWIVCSFKYSTKAGDGVFGNDKWWVCLEDLNPPLPHSEYRRSRAIKKVEGGIAVLVETSLQYEGHPEPTLAVKPRIFSTLPLPEEISSYVPVHVHGTFSLSGDRRSLIVNGETAEHDVSEWNSWLLGKALPDLYLNVLHDLARQIGREVFKFWPAKDAPKGTWSELLCTSFWEKLPGSSEKLFPRAAQQVDNSLPRLLDIKTSIFSFLPEDRHTTLVKLLEEFLPELVSRVSPAIAQRLKLLKVHNISGVLLRDLFKTNSSSRSLQTEIARNEDAFHAFVHELNLTSTDNEFNVFHGCILPLADGTLGVMSRLEMDTVTSTYYIANEREVELFSDFAAGLLIPEKFVKSLRPAINTGKFNVSSRLEPPHIPRLLQSRADRFDQKSKQWIEDFWKFYNGEFSSATHKLRPVTEAADRDPSSETRKVSPVFGAADGLCNKKLFRAKRDGRENYYCPSDLDTMPAVVEPLEEASILLCNAIPGLVRFDRLFMPKSLREKESTFRCQPSFERLLAAMNKLAQQAQMTLGNFVRKFFVGEALTVLQELVIHYVAQSDYLEFQVKILLGELPLWPTCSESSPGSMIAAIGSNIAPSKDFLVPWVPGLNKFLCPSFLAESEHETWLESIGALKVTERDMIIDHILPNFPKGSLDVARPGYDRLIACIAEQHSLVKNKEVKILLENAKIAADSNGKLHQASALFDHSDELFLAAFGKQSATAFLCGEVRQFRSFWTKIGLRHRANSNSFTSGQVYLDCLLEMEKRLQDSKHELAEIPGLCKNLDIVLGPLTRAPYALYRLTAAEWLSVSRKKVFLSRRAYENEPRYRQIPMDVLAIEQPLLTLVDIVFHEYAAVSWSQVPYALHEPTKDALRLVHRDGEPSILNVVRHINHLQEMSANLEAEDIKDFLSDLNSSYSFLQSHLADSQKFFDGNTSGICSGPMWLNLDITEAVLPSVEDINFGWKRMEHLLLSSLTDATPLESLRSSLVPYQTLLSGLGCERVHSVQVVLPKPADFSLTALLSQMRNNGQFDVAFKAEGKLIPAHRLVLSAVSRYCAATFSGLWAAEKEIELPEEVKYHALSIVIKFSYEEPIDWVNVAIETVEKATYARPDESAELDKLDQKADELLEVHQAADYFDMPALANLVIRKIFELDSNFLRHETVDHLLARAREVNAKELASLCMDWCEKNKETMERYRQATA